MTVISLAPAVLLMTTSFVRIVVVLGLLRQALGTQQLPPNQVITSMALFMTLLVMTPVWKQVYDDADPAVHQPARSASNRLGTRVSDRCASSWPTRSAAPTITTTSGLFLRYLQARPTGDARIDYAYYSPAENQRLVPLAVLLPAFMLSELKTAFLIGFQIYLPFVILDIVVASVTISMGMLMLPPVLISLPFKLLLFVLVDGWHLVVEMLLESFQQFI